MHNNAHVRCVHSRSHRNQTHRCIDLLAHVEQDCGGQHALHDLSPQAPIEAQQPCGTTFEYACTNSKCVYASPLLHAGGVGPFARVENFAEPVLAQQASGLRSKLWLRAIPGRCLIQTLSFTEPTPGCANQITENTCRSRTVRLPDAEEGIEGAGVPQLRLCGGAGGH